MVTTKGPMWGYPVFVLGAVCSFLEPFCGHLSPNIDNVSEKLTLRYPHKGPWVAAGRVEADGTRLAEGLTGLTIKSREEEAEERRER